jgi:hypothetical protein
VPGTGEEATDDRADDDPETNDLGPPPTRQRRAGAKDRVRAHRLIGQMSSDEPTEESDHRAHENPSENVGVPR